MFTTYVTKGKEWRYKPFNVISNPEDAYLIGYLSSDGTYSVTTKTNGKVYGRMGVSSTSIDIIEYFKETYAPDNKLNYRQPRSSVKVNAINPTVELWFPSIYRNTFNIFGIYKHKPERDIKNVSIEFMNSCLLGIMDADGCFVIRNREDCNIKLLNVHIVSSATNLLKTIQAHLKITLNINSSIYVRKNNNCSELRINNTQDSIKFGKYIYNNLPTKFNENKYNIFKSYCDLYNIDINTQQYWQGQIVN